MHRCRVAIALFSRLIQLGHWICVCAGVSALPCRVFFWGLKRDVKRDLRTLSIQRIRDHRRRELLVAVPPLLGGNLRGCGFSTRVWLPTMRCWMGECGAGRVMCAL